MGASSGDDPLRRSAGSRAGHDGHVRRVANGGGMAPEGVAGIWSHQNTAALPPPPPDPPLVIAEPSRVSVVIRPPGVGVQLWLGTGDLPKHEAFVTGVTLDELSLVYTGEISLEDA